MPIPNSCELFIDMFQRHFPMMKYSHNIGSTLIQHTIPSHPYHDDQYILNYFLSLTMHAFANNTFTTELFALPPSPTTPASS